MMLVIIFLAVIMIGAIISVCWMLRRNKAQAHIASHEAALQLSDKQSNSPCHAESSDKNSDHQQAIFAALLKQLTDIVTILKSSDLNKNQYKHLWWRIIQRNAALYALPWILVLGTSGSGKSTLIKQSQLHFPLAKSVNTLPFQEDDAALLVHSGWYLADEGVLIDSCGHYLDDQQYRFEWLSLLKLIKKYRCKLPLNGIVLTIDLPVILTADEAALKKLANLYRERLAEIAQTIGFVLPIHIVLTKMDHLLGFAEYFADWTGKQREQVCGISLCHISQYTQRIGVIINHLQLLYQKLLRYRLTKIAFAERTQQKMLIFNFPEQFRITSQAILSFIRILLKDNPYQETPHFAGIYFSSAVDPCFIKSLFSEVVFKQNNDVVKNREHLQYMRWLKSIVLIISGSLVFGLWILFDVALARNSALLQQGVQTVANYYLSLKAMNGILSNEAVVNNQERQPVANSQIFQENAVYQSQEQSVGNYKAAIYHLLPLFNYYRQLAPVITSVSSEPEISHTLAERGMSSTTPELVNPNKSISPRNDSNLSEESRFQDNQVIAIPAYLHLGLYRGNLLVNDIQDLLLQKLKDLFLQPTARLLERKLQQDAQQWAQSDEAQREQLRGSYYSLLKVYLMLCFPLQMDVQFTETIIKQLWQQLSFAQQASLDEISAVDNPRDSTMLAALLNFYLQQSYEQKLQQLTTMNYFNSSGTEDLSWQVNKQLVNKARAQLNSTAANNLYAEIRSAGISQLAYTSLAELLNGSAANQFQSQYQLPVLFTQRGWQTFAKAAIQQTAQFATRGDWVIDVPLQDLTQTNYNDVSEKTTAATQNIQLTAQLQQLYFAEYQQRWLEFLHSIQVVTFHSIPEAAQQLQIYASQQGPYDQLFHIIAENSLMSSQASNLLNYQTSMQYLQHLAQVQNELARLTINSDLPGAALHFAARLLANSSILSMSTNRYQDFNNTITNNSNDVSFADNNGESALYNTALFSAIAVSNINDMQARAIMENLLLLPLKATWGAILNSAEQGLQQHWREEIINAYQFKLAQQNPFANSHEEASFDDVANFFQPRIGLFWRFYLQQIAPFVIADAEGFQARTWLNRGMEFSPSFLSTLNQAQQISNGFFGHGNEQQFMTNEQSLSHNEQQQFANEQSLSTAEQAQFSNEDLGLINAQPGSYLQPQFTFAIFPIPTPGIDEITLTTNGQTYRYRNEPQEWQNFNWPGNASHNDTVLEIISAQDQNHAALEINSVWGFFELLRHAVISPEESGVYRATWQLSSDDGHHYKVSLLFRMDNKANLFEQILVHKFVLPDNCFA